MRYAGLTGEGGFDEMPTPEQLQAWQQRMSLPDNELAASVGLTLVLGRTPDVVVAVANVGAYSRGFRFTLVVQLRTALPGTLGGRLFELIAGHRHHPLGVGADASELLLLGIEFSDGRRASTLDEPAWGPPSMAGSPDPHELVLIQQGGSGGELNVEQDYWVNQIPPPGPLTFVHSWTLGSLPEARTVVDAELIRSAAARSIVLWEPQPIALEPPEPPPLGRPSSGWFSGGPAD